MFVLKAITLRFIITSTRVKREGFKVADDRPMMVMMTDGAMQRRSVVTLYGS